MPIVEYTTIGGGLIDKDKEAMKRYYMLQRSAVTKQRTKYSRADKQALADNSYIGLISEAWNALTDGERADWKTAGLVCGLDGYNLFTQDKAYRIKNSIAGNATPSIYHQYLVGHLHIDEGAGDCHFKQANTNIFTFPATLYIRFKTALLADPANGEFIKVRFKYEYDEGGGPTWQTDELSLSLSQSWNNQSLAITEHTGLTGEWSFEIETHAVKGDFYFDDFFVETASGIITRDDNCEQVEKRWQLVKYPAGATIATLYPQNDAL